MKELIKIYPNEMLIRAVNARELHEKLEIKQDFSGWIKAQIVRADLIENIDYLTLTEKRERQTLIEYIVSIDASKNIAMLSQSAKGKEVRAYFIECEKQLVQQKPKLPQNYIEALQALILCEQQKQETEHRLAAANFHLDDIVENELKYSKNYVKEWGNC